MVLVSKMTRVSKTKSKLYAIGRVISGKIYHCLKVRILSDNYVKGKKIDLFEKFLP